LHAIGEQSTSAYPSIKPSDIENLDIVLPPLEIQKEVSRTLRVLDEKIENNRKINHHLEQMAQSIFKSWFINFEPFEGKQLSSWKDSLLFDLATVAYGKNLPTKKLLPSGYRVFGGNGQIGYYSEYLYKDERILISCRGAASGSVRFSRPYSFVTNNSLVINEESKNLYPYLKQWALNRQFFDAVTGSAQPQVTVDSLKLITLIPPDDETLGEFSKTIQPIYDMIERNTEESEQLIVLRDELLPKLMSGELSVTD
jgi:type I restriction enzyme S subunit